MILAAHQLDDAAREFLEAEVGDCAGCWRDAALRATEVGADLLAEAEENPTGWALYAIERHIESEMLDAEENPLPESAAETTESMNSERPEMIDDNSLIPLSLIALEINASISALVDKFGESVVTDPATGLRSVPADRSRVFIAAHWAGVKAERERDARRQAERAANDPAKALHRRLRARREHQLRQRGDGPALARALADEHDARELDEMLAPPGAPLKYHPINGESNQ